MFDIKQRMYASTRDEGVQKRLRELERDQSFIFDSMILKAIARERELTNKRIEKTAQDTMVAIRQQLIQRRMGARA